MNTVDTKEVYFKFTTIQADSCIIERTAKIEDLAMWGCRNFRITTIYYNFAFLNQKRRRICLKMKVKPFFKIYKFLI